MAIKSNIHNVACKYFTSEGHSNTEEVLKTVEQRAKNSEIKNILVATRSGRTAVKARQILSDNLRIIAVTHVTGFNEPNTQELEDELQEKLLASGVKILTCAHAFGGVGKGFRNKTGTYQVDEIIAYTLRMFGQGTKVAIEIALMAADSGLIRTDEDIISIGGTKRGADTALVLQPSTSSHCFDLSVREILCKPSCF
jgi:uncharacterized protein